MKRIVSFFGDDTEIFHKLNRDAKEYAASLDIEYKWALQNPFSKENVISELQDADAGIIDVQPFGEDIFSQLHGEKAAKLLVRFGVGFDSVDLDAATKHGIAIARTTGANTTAVAEMALMMMLMSRRRMNVYQARLRAGDWKKDIGHELIGATVGIIGFGSIGQRLSRLLTGFDCRVLSYDPFTPKDVAEKLNVQLVDLETLFKEADAISIHVNYTKETHHMVNEKMISLMKPSAVIVNTARGNIIDEDALAKALRENKIAGTGVDVFAKEPLPLSSALLENSEAILTPHVSSQTVESLWNIYKTAIDICADFFKGKKSRHILN